jgi:ABC-type glycerol-3-phosphate transport system permease component
LLPHVAVHVCFFSWIMKGFFDSISPMLTVRMAQFVHETGIEWHLMSATAVMAIGPALVVTRFAQEYVVKGLRI